ncbi:MAG: amino acid adenylation domain-containing protein [Burkholderiaceae bacterium]|nr:MAG: amino acid adenylation domain-containing protein [Burkholderiaceae bacterium]
MNDRVHPLIGTSADVLLAEDFDPFAGGDIERVVPTTEAQREVWLADQLGTEASLAYNESASLRFTGRLDAAALQAALQGLVQRHDALRATIGPDGSELLIGADARLPLELIDLRGLGDEAMTQRLDALRRDAVETPFDLAQGPLLRASLARLGDDAHELVLTAHHIVCDGWSLGVIAHELMALYRAQRDGQPADLPPAPSYAEHALAQSAAEAVQQREADERYWLSVHQGGVTPLELPCDRARPAGTRSFASRREDLLVDTETTAAIRALAARHGCSLFATLFSGFAALLSRLSGASDLTIGVPAAGQAAAGQDGLVGHCVTLLPVRLTLDLEQSAGAALAAARAAVLDAYDHQQCTLGSLLKRLQLPRDPSRLPLVSVLFNLDSALPDNALPDAALRVSVRGNPRSFENYELFLNVSQLGDTLQLECQYNTGLFDAASVKRWLGLYVEALRRLCSGDALALAVALEPTPNELDLLERFNASIHEHDRTARIDALIAAQARATPEALAVRSQGRELSYRALLQRADDLAGELQRRGVGPGELVGISCSRSECMLIAVVGVLRSGAGYVPLDPSFPADRLEFMSRDAGLRFIATDTGVDGDWKFPSAEPVDVNALPSLNGPIEIRGSVDDVAYVIYTSGSTGKPKGVRVPHRSVTNLLASLRVTPGFAAAQRVLSVTTLSFDIAVSEVIMPLTVGACVVVADGAQATDGERLRELIEREAVNVIDATPSTWRMLLSAGWPGNRELMAICTGEPLPPDLGLELLPRVGQLWNGYGPTETTVWSSFHRVLEVDGPVPIGRPVANTRFDVVDSQLRLLPVGAIGELLIAGEGVTLGYLDRPELTAERFVPDPLRGRGALRYRTGDLGRWRNDGVLECLGRIDHQIKLRGYRIELGDIESNLATHPQVQRALAVTREFAPGDVRIVAYVVPQDGTPEPAALRRHLAARLPEYMVPQHIVSLAAIPLLPNGKIDRRSLPAPEAAAGVSVSSPRAAEPRTPTQQLVAETMEAILALPGMANDDNFFRLGGHSLLATQLANRLGQATGTRVPLRAIFEAPTIAQLAAWLDAKLAAAPASAPLAELAPPPATGLSEPLQAPLSLMQQRIWFFEQMEPGRVTYNTPSAHRLKGPLDVAALERSFNEMIRRQPILRTALVAGADGEPIQKIEPALTISLTPIEDLSALPPAQREEELLARMKARVAVPIALGEAPLFRHGLYKLGEQEHVLFFMPHHAIWDGWSFDLLYEEMAALYGAHVQGRTPDLPPLPTSYAAFAGAQQGWLESTELREQLDHWKQRLAGLPEPLALPADRSRPARASGEGSTEWVRCPKPLADAARRFGAETDATLFMTLLAAYALLLSRLSGQHDLVIGTPVRGRNDGALEKVMGFFVNALPLRLQVGQQANFRSLVTHVRDVVLDAFSAPDVPFEHLVRELRVPRDESRSPIYQAFFSFQDARRRIRRWGELSQEQVLLFQPGTAEDLGLWFLENDEGLTGGLTYNTDIFGAATARHLGERFAALLGAAITEPDAPLDTLPLATAAERASIDRWSQGRAQELPARTVCDLIAAQMERTPGHEALVTTDEVLDYAELDRRASKLARLLRSRGIARGALVGLCLERSAAMVVAQLAVMRAGAAYVPLDPAYPAERLAYMAEDARIALLVADSSTIQSIEWPRQQSVLLDVDLMAIERQSDAPLEPDAAADARPEDPAYVIYTSGSTGRPKGVVLPHRAVVNFLLSMQREPGLAEGDRIVAVTTLSFDIAVLELLLPLTVGATVLLASRVDTGDGHALRSLVESQGGNVMQATPSTWRMLIDAGWTGGPAFKSLVGGEALAPDLAAALLERSGELWNMYGPTETTVWSTCWRVQPSENGIAIGCPIGNTVVRVLDVQQRPCPIGVPGELYIGGDGVATGYLNRPELTAERFIDDPLAPGRPLYRTGDQGRWRHDGLLEHLGRLDTQVKLRGHRIELGEIEAQLAAHAGVARAVCAVREAGPGDARLVAYIVPRGEMPSAAELREQLRMQLPDYMLPQHYLAIDSVPLLPNGKVAHAQLPGIAGAADTTRSSSFDAPKTETEVAIAAIWCRLLGVERVGRSDNFFDLGGHSLLAMRVVVEVEKQFGVRLGVRRLIFETLPQVADLPSPGAAEAPGAPAAPAARGWLGKVVKSLRE